jgi:hypothetical protein
MTIDGSQLAFVHADYQVVRDGQALSRGVGFTLVREPGGWRLAVVAYTSIPITR